MVASLQIRKSCIAAILIGTGILLPQLLHIIGGSSAGKMFLPMHLPVFIAGLLLGPVYGTLTSIITPCISFLITGMPGQATLPFMLLEMLIYGLMSGYMAKRTKNLYIVLIISQIAGRIANGTAMMVVFYCMGISANPIDTFITSVFLGIPGLLFQYFFIPQIIPRLKGVFA